MRRHFFFDKQGNGITPEEFERLHADLDGYRRIGVARVGGYEVSTVWLGTDYGFGPDTGLILFETMIFGDGPLGDFQYRYATEEQATRGHAAIVAALRENQDPEEAVSSEAWSAQC